MNKDNITMAEGLRKKLGKAIEILDPGTIKPNEIGSLMKVAVDLEKQARIDTIAQEELRSQLLGGDTENPNLKKSVTKQDDLAEIVGILLKSGALTNITQIGVRTTETKTTETIVKGDD
jgi:hypothetical protein